MVSVIHVLYMFYVLGISSCILLAYYASTSTLMVEHEKTKTPTTRKFWRTSSGDESCAHFAQPNLIKPLLVMGAGLTYSASVEKKAPRAHQGTSWALFGKWAQNIPASARP